MTTVTRLVFSPLGATVVGAPWLCPPARCTMSAPLLLQLFLLSKIVVGDNFPTLSALLLALFLI